ncbi:MAG: hypothetical protein U0670_18330 [Anaerolineae bacterium]
MFTNHPEVTRSITRNHQRELRRFADQQRLARTVLSERLLYSPLMVSVGRKMVAWGTRLQSRYTECTDALTEWQARDSARDSVRATSEIALARK